MRDISAPEMERALIGELLLKQDILMDAIQELTVDDFAVPECRRIYEACRALFVMGRGIDVLTVLNEVSSADELERTSWKGFMLGLTQNIVSFVNCKDHIRIIRDTGRMRRAAEQAGKLLSAIEDTGNMAVCRDAAADLMRAFDGLDGSETVTAAEGYKRFMDEIGKVKEYISTGIGAVDFYVKISRGDFIVIGGRPSTGKTAFTLQMMLKMAERHNVVYFSLETSTDKLFERMIANYATSDYGAIRTGGLKQSEIDYIAGNCDGKFPELNFSVVNAAGWSVEQIKSRALQMKAEVIYIDYLGLISATSGKSQYEKVTQISLDLHTMAQRDKIAVVTLVQLNRAGTAQPDMATLRDSGQIEQDADVILLLSTPKDDAEHRDEKLMTIAKNKDGMVGEVRFNFAGKYQQFHAIEKEHEK